MNTGSVFRIYEELKDDVKFITGSDVRTKIIISLKERKKNLSDLKKEIKLSSSTILHEINHLEERKFVFKESREYSLSQTGEIIALKLIDLIKACSSLQSCENIFLRHEIKCIPEDLLKEIGCLNNSIIVESTITDIIKPQKIHAKLVSEAQNVKSISSIFYPNEEALLKKTLEKGSLHLILTEEILNKWIEIKGYEKLKDAISKKNLKLWKMNDDVKMSFTVTDKSVVLGLFSIDGLYDLHMYLINEDKEAIEWGNKLFNYYTGHSEEVKL